jgi:drug/metabolite transporter (DMT)-like permease
MPLAALVLVLVAALLHAVWNIVAKRSGGGVHFAFLSALCMAVLWAPVGAWFAWREIPDWDVRAWTTVLASGLAHLVYFNALLAGYRAADLTVVYPIARGSGPLVTAGCAVLLLDEPIGVATVAGVALVSLGVFCIAGGAVRRGSTDADARHRRRRGMAWGAAIGLTIAVYSVVDGYAVKVLAISPLVLDWTSNLLRTACMVPRSLADRRGLVAEWRRTWLSALVLGVLSPLGYILVLFALRLAPLSHVAPAREVALLFAALLGGKLLGESDRGLRLLGAGCIAVGVIALAGG